MSLVHLIQHDDVVGLLNAGFENLSQELQQNGIEISDIKHSLTYWHSSLNNYQWPIFHEDREEKAPSGFIQYSPDLDPDPPKRGLFRKVGSQKEFVSRYLSAFDGPYVIVTEEKYMDLFRCLLPDYKIEEHRAT